MVHEEIMVGMNEETQEGEVQEHGIEIGSRTMTGPEMDTKVRDNSEEVDSEETSVEMGDIEVKGTKITKAIKVTRVMVTRDIRTFKVGIISEDNARARAVSEVTGDRTVAEGKEIGDKVKEGGLGPKATCKISPSNS